MEKDFIDGASIKSSSKIKNDIFKKYSVSEIRQKYPKAYAPWTRDEDILLEKMFKEKSKINDLSKIFGRKRGAINSRLVKLGLKI